MSKIGDYLNQHLVGDVLIDTTTRANYSTDSSILHIAPHLIVMPRVLDDVRKIARFTWRLAERGQVLPVTVRGAGMDVTGAAIGAGVVLSFINHMSHIMELDVKSRMVRVQPGMRLSALQEAMATHGLWLPIRTDADQVHTIGGLLGANAVSDGFCKYGTMLDWVDRVEVVLANGEVIQTGRLSRKELSAKKGLETLEGELYRTIDSLIEDNPETVDMISAGTVLDNTGYALDRVKDKDGTFDLTPLFVGSQGSLGIITQVILNLMPLPEPTSMIVAAVTDDQNLSDLTNRLLETEPSAMSFIDGDTLRLIMAITGGEPWSIVTRNIPKALVFIEYDDKHSDRRMRRAGKVLDSAAVADAKVAITPEDVEVLGSLRNMTAVINNYNNAGRSALPIVTDMAVAPESVLDAVDKIRDILTNNHVKAGVWGNLGAGTITVKPILNLANLGHRQIVFRLLKALTKLSNEHDGSISGGHGPGRLLSPYAMARYDKETVEVFDKVKKAFDPFGILNTGVRATGTQEELVRGLRQDYNNDRYYEYNLRG